MHEEKSEDDGSHHEKRLSRNHKLLNLNCESIRAKVRNASAEEGDSKDEQEARKPVKKIQYEIIVSQQQVERHKRNDGEGFAEVDVE